jgi:hypothetical protein
MWQEPMESAFGRFAWLSSIHLALLMYGKLEGPNGPNMRNAHRQRVLDLIAKDTNASRITIWTKASGTYQYMRKRDRQWFEETLPQLVRRAGRAPRARRLDREHLDSELAEKVTHIISELKSNSHRSVRITKTGVLRRAGCLGRYSQFPSALPKTEAVLREHMEDG